MTETLVYFVHTLQIGKSIQKQNVELSSSPPWRNNRLCCTPEVPEMQVRFEAEPERLQWPASRISVRVQPLRLTVQRSPILRSLLSTLSVADRCAFFLPFSANCLPPSTHPHPVTAHPPSPFPPAPTLPPLFRLLLPE